MVTSPVQPSEGVIQQALNIHAERAPIYQLYIDYYEGHHDLSFATNKWRNAFGNMFRQFADNLCAPIVDAAADRMQITGFAVADDEITTKALWRLWTTNKMDRKAGTIHEHVFKTGDAYAIVWPNADGRAVISPNPAHQVCVYYADDGETVLWASKLWQLGNKQWRLNLYYPNSIEKYITTSQVNGIPVKASAFRVYLVPGEMWPMPNPYSKVPVFHFANKPEMGVWGESELYNVIKLQDALNKSVADMLIAMEYVSLPQRFVTGIEVETDPITGKPKVPFESGVDRVWSAESEEARFGQFDPGNFESFTKVQNDFRLEMARISRTPLHYLSLGGQTEGAFVSSTYPSGEALKTAEAPFIAKLRDRQTSFGDVWEEIQGFVAQIEGIDLDPADVETQWESPAPRSITDDVSIALQKQQLGVPLEVIWAELGYTAQQIEAMKRMPPPVQSNQVNNGTQVDSQRNQASGSVQR